MEIYNNFKYFVHTCMEHWTSYLSIDYVNLKNFRLPFTLKSLFVSKKFKKTSKQTYICSKTLGFIKVIFYMIESFWEKIIPFFLVTLLLLVGDLKVRWKPTKDKEKYTSVD